MPSYVYKCTNCKKEMEIKHGYDEWFVVCPKCNKPALKKLIKPAAIKFIGDGFYATDNRK